MVKKIGHAVQLIFAVMCTASLFFFVPAMASESDCDEFTFFSDWGNRILDADTALIKLFQVSPESLGRFHIIVRLDHIASSVANYRNIIGVEQMYQRNINKPLTGSAKDMVKMLKKDSLEQLIKGIDSGRSEIGGEQLLVKDQLIKRQLSDTGDLLQDLFFNLAPCLGRI